MVDEKQVSEIVKNVIAGMDISSFDNKPARKQLGVFDTMEEAIAACNKAYTTFRHYNAYAVPEGEFATWTGVRVDW